MKQKQYAPQSIAEMGLLIYAADNEYLKDVEVDKVGDFENALLAYMKTEHGDFMDSVVASGDWNDDIEATFKSALETFKSTQTW
jgi:F-type H+-transporting ATPase subunit alpha